MEPLVQLLHIADIPGHEGLFSSAAEASILRGTRSRGNNPFTALLNLENGLELLAEKCSVNGSEELVNSPATESEC